MTRDRHLDAVCRRWQGHQRISKSLMKFKMRRLTSLLAPIFLFSVASTKGDGGDETLKFFLSKSDLVVMGKFTAEPDGHTTHPGVLQYLCEFQIQDVLKGNTGLKNQAIKLVLTCFEVTSEDKHPLVNKDGECILFLNQAPPQNKPPWRSADFWFGVQPPSPTMAASLKRLAVEMSASPEREIKSTR